MPTLARSGIDIRSCSPGELPSSTATLGLPSTVCKEPPNRLPLLLFAESSWLHDSCSWVFWDISMWRSSQGRGTWESDIVSTLLPSMVPISLMGTSGLRVAIQFLHVSMEVSRGAMGANFTLKRRFSSYSGINAQYVIFLYTTAWITYIEAIHKENAVSLSYSFYPLFAVPQRKTLLQRRDKFQAITNNLAGGMWSIHKSGFHLTPWRGLTLPEPAVSHLPLTNSAAREGCRKFIKSTKKESFCSHKTLR